MTQDELDQQYALSARPYIETRSPVPKAALKLKSWRYLLELNSACNLRCVLCVNGNTQGMERTKGNQTMDLGLLGRVLKKMQSENPHAIVCPYGNGEPFLYPHLPEAIKAIKDHGFVVDLATNLHYTHRLEEVLAAAPDVMIVSLSGFTQETYSKFHVGGNIDTVKANLVKLADLKAKRGGPDNVLVHFHKYTDNQHERNLAANFAAKLGLRFIESFARTISIENTIQSLRHLDGQNGRSVRPLPPDAASILPPVSEDYIRSMERLVSSPVDSVASYAHFPVASVCLIGDVFTYIRHDGQVQLCAWTDDRRLVLGSYLDLTQEQISEARRSVPLCQECLHYRLNLYYHLVEGRAVGHGVIHLSYVVPGNLPGAPPASNYIASIRKFAQSFKDNPPGADYDLTLINSNGGFTPKIKKIFDEAGITYKVFEYRGTGWDIGAHQAFSRTLGPEEWICCLSTCSWFSQKEWLAPFAKARLIAPDALYGSSGSGYYGFHVRTTGFMLKAKHMQATKPVTNREECYQFEHGADSLTKQMIRRGGAYVVTPDGCVPWELSSKMEQGFWTGQQRDVLVRDHHSDYYDTTIPAERIRLYNLSHPK